jgi:hypothetical protein
MVMSKKGVIVEDGSSVTFGLLGDFFDQLEANKKDSSKGKSGTQLRDFLENRNPFPALSESEGFFPLQSGDTISVSYKECSIRIFCWRKSIGIKDRISGISGAELYLPGYSGWHDEKERKCMAANIAFIIAVAAGFSAEFVENTESWKTEVCFMIIPSVPKSKNPMLP